MYVIRFKIMNVVMRRKSSCMMTTTQLVDIPYKTYNMVHRSREQQPPLNGAHIIGRHVHTGQQ